MPFPVFLFLLFFVAVPVQEFEFELVIIGHEVLGLPAGILRITVILCRFYRSVYLRCGSSGLGCCRSGSLRRGSSGLGCCRSGSLRCGSSGLGCCRSGSLRCGSSGLGCRRSGSLCRGSCLLACRSLSLHRSAALSGGLSCGTSLCSHFMHHFLATLGSAALRCRSSTLTSAGLGSVHSSSAKCCFLRIREISRIRHILDLEDQQSDMLSPVSMTISSMP